MSCEFPCSYKSNGCEVNLPFGTKMSEHESVCEFRLNNVCPITDTCKWKGETEKIFQHCVDEHSENVLKSLTFDFNLETSANKKLIIKFGNGRLYLLHLLYSSEPDGLSITVCNLAFEKGNQLLELYDLMLKSPDRRNMCHFKGFENGKYISKAALNYLDKSNVTIELSIACSTEEKTRPMCDLCDGTLPMYMLKCDSQHYSCMACSKLGDTCKVCNTDSPLTIKSNYNMLMQYKNGVFGCCNVEQGCSFSGLVNELKIHEQTCKVYKCFKPNCKWSGDIIAHIEKMHYYKLDGERIEVKYDTLPKNNRPMQIFLMLSKRCRGNHYNNRCNKYSPDMLVVIEVRNLNNRNLLQITANNISSHPNFTFGSINVIFGQNVVTYTNKISSVIASNMSINYENSLFIVPKLFKKHRYLRINVIESKFECDKHNLRTRNVYR